MILSGANPWIEAHPQNREHQQNSTLLLCTQYHASSSRAMLRSRIHMIDDPERKMFPHSIFTSPRLPWRQRKSAEDQLFFSRLEANAWSLEGAPDRVGASLCSLTSSRSSTK